MSEKRYRNNTFHQIGEGVETPVFALKHMRNGRERLRSFVIKTYESLNSDEEADGWYADENGFNEAIKKHIEKRQVLLLSAFAPYIPTAEIITNPTHPEKYIFIQSRLDLAPDPDVFGFTPEDFQDDAHTSPEEAVVNQKTRTQLLDIASRLKQQVTLYEGDNAKGAVILDLEAGKNNLVIDKKGDLYYVDLGAYTIDDGSSIKRDNTRYKQKIAFIELLGGRSVEELTADDFYAGVDLSKIENNDDDQ